MLNLSKYNDEAGMKLYEKTDFITEMIVKNPAEKICINCSCLIVKKMLLSDL